MGPLLAPSSRGRGWPGPLDTVFCRRDLCSKKTGKCPRHGRIESLAPPQRGGRFSGRPSPQAQQAPNAPLRLSMPAAGVLAATVTWTTRTTRMIQTTVYILVIPSGYFIVEKSAPQSFQCAAVLPHLAAASIFFRFSSRDHSKICISTSAKSGENISKSSSNNFFLFGIYIN